jgi:hypothetical protein
MNWISSRYFVVLYVLCTNWYMHTIAMFSNHCRVSSIAYRIYSYVHVRVTLMLLHATSPCVCHVGITNYGK